MSWKAKAFEEKMTPFIDDIYRSVFGNRLVEIYRSERGMENNSRVMFMDTELAIDTHLTFNNGSVLTFQEKSRNFNFLKYRDFTFEYYNDPNTGDQGEWFKLAAQLYFYGYANQDETGYAAYWILNVAKLRTALLKRYTLLQMEREFLRQNKPPAKASFFAIPLGLIETFDGVVLHKQTASLKAA